MSHVSWAAALAAWFLMLCISTQDAQCAEGPKSGGMKKSRGSDRYHPPWLLPDDVQPQLTLIDRADLQKVLQIQSKNKWVTVFVYDALITRWLLNSVYSYLQYGKARHYIVAVVNEDSLQKCMQLRLPCYNATHHFPDVQPSGDLTDQDRLQEIAWGRMSLLHEVLSTGLNVHISDLDVVYLREVLPSYNTLFLKYKVDALFMKDRFLPMGQEAMAGINRLKRRAGRTGGSRHLAASLEHQSTDMEVEDEGVIGDEPALPHAPLSLVVDGVYAVRSTNESLAMVEKWMEARRPGLTVSEMLNEQAFRSYMICGGPAACASARLQGWATVFRHAPQMGPSGPCLNTLAAKYACDTARLYAHAVCQKGWGTSGPRSKGGLLQELKLWLVDEEGLPLYAGLQGSGSRAVTKEHPYLPCKGIAWSEE